MAKGNSLSSLIQMRKVREALRNPSLVLNNLESKSKIEGYTFKRLYRNLYNLEFYLNAYEKIYAKAGNMTEGTDGKTINGMSIERIHRVIENIKDESYKPSPAKRTYIPKKNGRKNHWEYHLLMTS